MSPEVIFRGANSTKGFTSPERNPTNPYHLLLCICKENPLALTIFHYIGVGLWAMGVEVSVAVLYPTGHTTLLQR